MNINININTHKNKIINKQTNTLFTASKLTLLALSFTLLGCADEQAAPLLYQVKQQQLSVTIPAKGELFAAKATVISAPISRNGMQNIAWLAPEYSQVKKGDIIARFDGESMEIQATNKQHELAITEQELSEKTGMLNKQIGDISKDIGLIDQETQFAENFNIDDIRVRSKLDILDQLQNTEYLKSKQQYLNWQKGSFSASSAGEMGLLEMKQNQHQAKIKQLKQGLSQLEVKAPHDGLLVYKANWRGEKPKAGQAIWPGGKIAQLPDTNLMKVKLFVIENEAIDLKAEQAVSFHLNAFADTTFNGKVESVAPFPQSIKRGDPQKYFEVVVTLNEQNKQLFVPGRKLEAIINVTEKANTLLIPLQSVFSKHQQTFVYVYENGEYIETQVTLGQTSLSHVEVLSGLSTGQRISLTDQEHS